jgi:hypothetical protein
MPLLVRQILLMPLWLALVFTRERFFAPNPIIGDCWLNPPTPAGFEPTWPEFARARRARG